MWNVLGRLLLSRIRQLLFIQFMDLRDADFMEAKDFSSFIKRFETVRKHRFSKTVISLFKNAKSMNVFDF